MEHSQELAQRIRARIAELEADIEAHRRALAALKEPQARAQSKSNGERRPRARAVNGEASPAAEENESASKSAPAKSQRRPRPVVSPEAVFDALEEGNDQAAVIAQEFGVSTTAVRERLDQLEKAGRVSRTGERRSTRWRSGAAN